MNAPVDLFGAPLPGPRPKLKQPVKVALNVIDQSADAILVDHADAYALTWLPKSLCDWQGELGEQRLDVEAWKARERGWVT